MKELKAVIKEKPACLTDKRVLQGCLMDSGWDQRTVSVLVNLMDGGIVQKIQKNGGSLTQTDIYDLISQQERRHGTSRKFVEEGIGLWAKALGAKAELPISGTETEHCKQNSIPDLPLQSEPKSEPSKSPISKKRSPLLRIFLKILFGLFLIGFVSTVLPDMHSANNFHGTVGKNIQWKMKNGTLTISGSGAMPDYKYSENAPWGETAEMRASITTVNIEDGITRIGSRTFSGYPGYENLADVTIADSVKEIGDSAFMDCSALTNLKLPAALEMIEAHAFFSCLKLMDVDIPRTISYIGWQAFQGTGLHNVFLNDGTFSYMSFSKDVNVVDSLRNSGTCGENAEWTLDESGLLTISGTGEILSSDADFDHIAAPWYTQRMDITAITIEEGITGIGDGAFYDCENLQGVSIPSSVNFIGRDVFAHCASLTSIALPDGITDISLDSFSWCTALSTIQLPMKLTTIEARAFEWCKSLETVVIPDSVTNIGANAFHMCENLKSVTISKDCVVEEDAFPEWVEIK